MIGSKIIELGRVDSTNDYAAALVGREKFIEGTVVLAHEQYRGRGQNENSWLSEPGNNLTFTILLSPRFLPPDRQFLLNKVISLGVLDYIRSTMEHHNLTGRVPLTDDPGESRSSRILHPVAAIKWPNDLYIGTRKLGGILINHRILGSTLDTSIIGIGLNVNQLIFPAELPNPVSLKLVTAVETDLRIALKEICNSIEIRYNYLQAGAVAGIERDYLTALLGFGEWKEFVAGNVRFQGSVNGVDELGRLLVETRDQGIKVFNHKEVEIIL